MVWGDTPIQRKLIRVILLTSSVSLLVMGAIFVVFEFFAFKRAALNEIATLGKVIASNSVAPLAFNDKETALEVLSSVRHDDKIDLAVLYDKDNHVFAFYPAHSISIPEWIQDSENHFGLDKIDFLHPIVQGNRMYGTLYLRSNPGILYSKFYFYGGVVTIILLASTLVAYILSKRMQQGISNPIEQLAMTANMISTYHDYSVRAQKLADDELGLLTDVFNQMLAHIEQQSLALMASKEQLEHIVENMNDAYVALDKDWKYTFANYKALALMGKSEEDLLGKILWEVFPDIIGTSFEVEYRKVMDEKRAASFEIHYASYNMWLEIRSYPHEGGIAIFYTDITKYKQAEEGIRSFSEHLEQKVLERTDELEAVNKELESFSYSVSHDLRAPLRAVIGYMAILRREHSHQVDEEGQQVMNIISDSALRMGKLIDDLLHFSRLGRKELSLSPVNMKSLVGEVVKELSRDIQERRPEFVVEDLPLVMADYNTIRQVWTNLISNAIKYTRKVEQSLIRIGIWEEKEEEVVFYIKDNGAGFNMQYYNKLFGVFQRLHSQSEFEGTGVGLAIVQRIVNKHGGNVWAEAKTNAGATFYFSLKKSV